MVEEYAMTSIDVKRDLLTPFAGNANILALGNIAYHLQGKHMQHGRISVIGVMSCLSWGLVACGGSSPAEPSPSMEGQWRTALASQFTTDGYENWTMTLTDNDGVITGTAAASWNGSYSAAAGSAVYDVTGTRTDAHVTLNFTTNGASCTLNIQGSIWLYENELHGTMNGCGYNGVEVKWIS
jgi:hypothetical protein